MNIQSLYLRTYVQYLLPIDNVTDNNKRGIHFHLESQFETIF